MKLVVGLGNPGRTYQNTRHNVGFMTIDAVAEECQIPVEKEKFNAVYGKGSIESEEVILAKPLSFMNRSGESIAPMLHWFKIEPQDLVILCDDIHLPLGQIRIRERGSDGGHNGLTSVIESLGTPEFSRIRLGVNEPPPGFDQADYVLSRFPKQEKEQVEEMILNARDAVKLLVSKGVTTAMNRYNIRKKNELGEENA
jgi:PTH1 family peptidyl-tRNA hydrolase